MILNSRIIYKIASYSKNSIPLVRKISVLHSNLYPRFVNKDIENKVSETAKDENDQNTKQKFPKNKNEEKILRDIEVNLFEHSSIKSNPKVGSSEEIFKTYNKEQEKKPKKQNVEVQQKIKKKEFSSRMIEDSELGLTYTRLDLNHPLLSQLLMSVRSKKFRNKNQLILLEGRRLFLEAINCGIHLETVIFSQKDQLALIGQKYLNRISKVGSIYKVPHHDLKIWSSLTTPPGIIGIFRRPTENEINLKLEKYEEENQRIPITVICDNIREPNNLGSIIRTSAAIPCAEVIILKGCCDPWESKALRSGCGGQFRICLKDDVNWDKYITNIMLENNNFFISENNLKRIEEFGFGKKTEIYSEVNINQDDHYYVIIGGETHGISDQVYSSLSKNKNNTKCIHIPLANGVESLNATTALSLLLFEIRKKYMKNINCKKDENEVNGLII